MKITDLKPCPFCGGEARKDFRSGRTGSTPVTKSRWFRGIVKCSTCGVTTPEKTNPEAAIKSWNTREQEAART